MATTIRAHEFDRGDIVRFAIASGIFVELKGRKVYVEVWDDDNGRFVEDVFDADDSRINRAENCGHTGRAALFLYMAKFTPGQFQNRLWIEEDWIREHLGVENIQTFLRLVVFVTTNDRLKRCVEKSGCMRSYTVD